MAYSTFLADRLEQRLRSKGLTEMKKMMGGLIFMVNEKMCVGIDIDKKNWLGSTHGARRESLPRTADLQ